MAQQAWIARTDYGTGVFVEGTGAGERIDGTDSIDLIFGYGGDDRLFGLGGHDTIDGGSGNDTIGGGSGNDHLVGGLGDDTLDGGADDDLLFGGTGNDIVVGGDGNDTITDHTGVDRISGGSGNDIIAVTGGDAFGFDRVDGGGDSDTITVAGQKVIAAGGSGNDTIKSDIVGDQVLIGGEGSDRFVINNLQWAGSRLAQIVGGDAQFSLNNVFGVESVGSVTIGADSAVDTLDLSPVVSANAYGARVDLAAGKLDHLGLEGSVGQAIPAATLSGIENVVGTGKIDIMIGNGVANDLSGLGGDDTINGNGGDDVVDGGAGNDKLSGGSHNDTVRGGDGADEIKGDGGNDRLHGGAGADTIDGGAGNDTIYGDFVGDGASADTLTGGADADTFVFVNAAKALQVTINGQLVQTQQVSITDRITDFDATGTDHDTLDFSFLLDTRSTFAGVKAQTALSQGYIYFVQNGNATTVMFDTNGGSHFDTANNFAIVELAGLAPADMRADHILV
jgi:Ca2+-binding RTX toxin-like protein